MDLINKLKVLMKISLAGSEVRNKSTTGNEKKKKVGEEEEEEEAVGPLRLSHHYLAQCLHRQCDMYELREMCRLQKVDVKRGASKREIIETIIDHLPKDDGFDPSPKEIANKTRKLKAHAPVDKSVSPSPPSRRDAPISDDQSMKRVAGKLNHCEPCLHYCAYLVYLVAHGRRFQSKSLSFSLT